MPFDRYEEMTGAARSYLETLEEAAKAFAGIWENGCWGTDGLMVSPAPNPYGLPGGGKI